MRVIGELLPVDLVTAIYQPGGIVRSYSYVSSPQLSWTSAPQYYDVGEPDTRTKLPSYGANNIQTGSSFPDPIHTRLGRLHPGTIPAVPCGAEFLSLSLAYAAYAPHYPRTLPWHI